jgi:hypothetical protein
MAFDLAGRGQFSLDAPDASAPARLPGDPIAGLQLFRHAVLRRKLRPQFAGGRKVAGKLAEGAGQPCLFASLAAVASRPSKNSVRIFFSKIRIYVKDILLTGSARAFGAAPTPG